VLINSIFVKFLSLSSGTLLKFHKIGIENVKFLTNIFVSSISAFIERLILFN